MSMTAGKRVGIKQVAEAAGVSASTVSQVYNHKGEASSATREHVLSIGAQLGYRPNVLGQALRSGRSRVIGVVVSYRDSAVWDQTYLPYYRNIIAGAAIEAVEHGYAISAAPSNEHGLTDTFLPLDGVIVVDPIPGDLVVEQCLATGMAIITDGGYETSNSAARLVTVRSDMDKGIPKVLDHLQAESAASVFRPALFVGPRLDSYTVDTIRAYKKWCEVAGFEAAVTTPEPSQSPLDAARTLLARGIRAVTAVHCLNETYCAAIFEAAAELGISIPDELQVSVAGNAAAMGAERRAVYLNLDPVETGARCARALISLLEGNDVTDIVEEVTLVPASQVVG
ncbi:LacI family DNA-binding transcriptional regulator [Glaciibacter psychrotolerans]|uniref:DNA-binding LacI/PurR family transcriptional regulator n=1 Tax=Glaciibacter psychrotolerans TaxID=670054 RepID=A0A7Z0EAT2_9MICO|nr:LacI family DNA-binding transcriptional regulator [Leifsonia psychrotolerans]NYJ18237.1 DNA-binding LacI/PurR family transcriptional regulator [Leifsonia psychrotolerans]